MVFDCFFFRLFFMCILFFILFTEINRVLDTVAQKMQLDFTQKLDSTDANMKETFAKQLKGKVRFFFYIF